jgi:hypothetical protein
MFSEKYWNDVKETFFAFQFSLSTFRSWHSINRIWASFEFFQAHKRLNNWGNVQKWMKSLSTCETVSKLPQSIFHHYKTDQRKLIINHFKRPDKSFRHRIIWIYRWRSSDAQNVISVEIVRSWSFFSQCYPILKVSGMWLMMKLCWANWVTSIPSRSYRKCQNRVKNDSKIQFSRNRFSNKFILNKRWNNGHKWIWKVFCQWILQNEYSSEFN